MLIRLIKAEFIKLKRSPVWLPFLIIPLISAFMGTFNYLGNREMLTGQWADLWTQHTLFSSFIFIPALIGLICAYEWRLEHRGHNWNTLFGAPVSRGAVILAKLTVVAALNLFLFALVGGLFFLCGRLVGFTTVPPYGLVLRSLGWGFLGSISAGCLQLFISMIMRNFGIPVALSSLGGIAGYLALAKGLKYICPQALVVYGMNAAGKYSLTGTKAISFVLAVLLFTAAAYLVSLLWLKKRDIQA